MIISTQANKGGTGKSTIAQHLAQGLSNLGYKVLLVDSDPQASSRQWTCHRQDKLPFSLMAMDVPVLHRELPDVASNYDLTVIDGCPRNTNLCRSAIMASDLVLIPVQPSPFDVWAVKETVDLIREAQIYRPHLQGSFVINLKIVNSVLGQEAQEVLTQYGLQVLNSQVSRRIAFPEAATSGRTVLDFRNLAFKAARQEMQQLIQEVEGKWLKLKAIS